ncbi:MAG: hypothetical protein LIP16_16735 [Clostridium sp.]|nr:hypothetical protein [Clostridium sp.]
MIKKKTPEGTKPEPLYRAIKAALLEDGSLPENFSLPKKKEEGKLTFADGAWDGIGMYHMGGGVQDVEPLYNVVRRISAGDFDKADRDLEDYFKEGANRTMLRLIDPLQEWVVEKREEIAAGALFKYAKKTMVGSANAECIKFAMSLLELLDIDGNPEMKEIVRTLAASDEFALYGGFLMRKWTLGNEEIFKMAKKVQGWGRIHAVEQLQPESREIREWLFYHGCSNNITSAYSARTCAEKTDFLGILKGEAFSGRDFSAAGRLMDGLLDEGPVLGISAMPNGREILAAYLERAETMAKTEEDYETACSIRDYLEREEGEMKDGLLEQCSSLLTSRKCTEFLRSSIEQGKGFRLACRLGIQCSEQIYEAIEGDFDKNYSLVDLLMSGETWAVRLAGLFEERLPLEAMKTGPEKNMGLGEGYEDYRRLVYMVQFLKEYPGVGENLLLCAMDSPVINCRNMALNVLESWKEKEWGMSPAIAAGIEKLRRREVDEKVKERLEAWRQL